MKLQFVLTLSLLVYSVVSQPHYRATPHIYQPAVPQYGDFITETNTEYPDAEDVTESSEVNKSDDHFLGNDSHSKETGVLGTEKSDMPSGKDVDNIDGDNSVLASTNSCSISLSRAKMYTCFDKFSTNRNESKNVQKIPVNSKQHLEYFCELRKDFVSCLKEKISTCSIEQRNVLWYGFNLDTILNRLDVICTNISNYKGKIECKVKHEKDICRRNYPPDQIMEVTEAEFVNYRQKLCKDYQNYLKCSIQVWDSHCDKDGKRLLADYNCALAKSTCTEEELYDICVAESESSEMMDDMPEDARKNKELHGHNINDFNHEHNQTEIHPVHNDYDNIHHDEEMTHTSEACLIFTSFLAPISMLSVCALLNF